VAKECYTDPDSDLFGCRPVAFIHDEILMEAPLEKVDAAAKRLCRVMEDAMTQYIPNVLIKAEPAAMLRWYKGAEPVWNEQGRLDLWEPGA
jgi:DNA polymerase I-like protein with 3'-5' exonuclease and polymerase domains